MKIKKELRKAIERLGHFPDELFTSLTTAEIEVIKKISGNGIGVNDHVPKFNDSHEQRNTTNK